ncbi:Crp/Fnr family transcriptional regulator [Mycobacterium simiae]|uniref:Crp/Fnr family transcriptional regulator n=1 Tax=Mycobacterium simiae TaxID=1784 RepID=UPI000778D5AC|nr:Crp/Fnr family transcriptional regulator [Mycobacterium simiae]
MHNRDEYESGDVHKALIASGIFAKTEREVVAGFARRLLLKRLPAGLVLDAERDFSGHVYVIVSGKVNLVYRRADDSELGLTVFGASQIFGAKTLFDPDSHGCFLITRTKVVVVPIAQEQLLGLMAEHPEIGEQLLRLFARWAKETGNLLADFAFADARVRTASRLLVLSKRFGFRVGDAVSVTHEMALSDFARLVRVDPDVVDPTLRGFADCGWIRLQGTDVVIVDAEALQSVCRCGSAQLGGAA